MLKLNGLYKTENPPKLKIKIDKAENKMFIDGNTDMIADGDAKKSKSSKKKEVLNYGNLVGIKLDDGEINPAPKPAIKEEVKQDDKPHIVMKLTKTSSDNLTSVITTTEPKPTQTEPTVIKVDNGSIKLKLKLPPPTSAPTAQITSINPRTSVDKSSELDALIRKDESESDNDDEVFSELKDSFADNDFVYPSINGKSKSRPSGNNADTSAGDNAEKKSVRKRKLKPFAAQYLQPKQTKIEENPSQEVKPEQAEATAAGEAAPKPEKPKKASKKMIDKLIEKNLKPKISDQEKEAKEALAKKEKANNDEEDKDKTYRSEDDEDEDDDEDFKLKCKNNLKLSKKIKSNLKKQQKLNEQPNLTPSALGLSTSTSKQNKKKDSSATASSTNAAQQNKKPKKGLTTTKQRLSKLLKLNRPL